MALRSAIIMICSCNEIIVTDCHRSADAGHVSMGVVSLGMTQQGDDFTEFENIRARHPTPLFRRFHEGFVELFTHLGAPCWWLQWRGRGGRFQEQLSRGYFLSPPPHLPPSEHPNSFPLKVPHLSPRNVFWLHQPPKPFRDTGFQF